jgi:hypothetical protein
MVLGVLAALNRILASRQPVHTWEAVIPAVVTLVATPAPYSDPSYHPKRIWPTFRDGI